MKNLAVMGVCGMHVDTFKLEHVNVILRSFCALSQNLRTNFSSHSKVYKNLCYWDPRCFM